MESKICPLFVGILGISRKWESSEIFLNCPLTSEEGSVIDFFGLGLGRCLCRPQKTFFTMYFYNPGNFDLRGSEHFIAKGFSNKEKD